MAILTAYFDESETLHSISGMAGWVGTLDQWAVVEARWREALVLDNRACLHLKEQSDPARLTPYARAIEYGGLFGVGHFVVLPHLDEFNLERHSRVEPYSLALYGCLLDLAAKFPNDTLTITLDRGDKVRRRISLALRYAQTDRYYSADRCQVIREKFTINPADKDRNLKDFPGLQAADFLAWELRRLGNEEKDFFLRHKTGEDPRQWRKQEIDWSCQTKGAWPSRRPSLVSLLRSDIDTMVWDRRTLETFHRFNHAGRP